MEFSGRASEIGMICKLGKNHNLSNSRGTAVDIGHNKATPDLNDINERNVSRKRLLGALAAVERAEVSSSERSYGARQQHFGGYFDEEPPIAD